MLIHTGLAVQRHIQQDAVDLLGNQPQIHPQQETGIRQVGRQGGAAGDVVSFHCHFPRFHSPLELLSLL
jgi:hypothetical protein